MSAARSPARRKVFWPIFWPRLRSLGLEGLEVLCLVIYSPPFYLAWVASRPAGELNPGAAPLRGVRLIGPPPKIG